MLFALGTGLALWIFYGVLRGDFVIIAANVVSLALVGFLVAFKIWTEYRPARR